MTRFTVVGDKLTYGKQTLGPATALFADANEKLVGKGVVGDKQNPERIDYLFVTDKPNEGKITGVESKTVDDLVSSWMAGRLQRQFRVLLETCDYQVLMIRGEPNWHDIDAEPEIRNDVLKWQMMGGLVVLGPKLSPLSCLVDVKMCLSGVRNVRTAIARYEKKVFDGTPQEKMLQGMFHGAGLGPKTAAKLMTKFGTVMKVLSGTDKEWRTCGATKKLLAAKALIL